MKKLILFVSTFLLMVSSLLAQQSDPWTKNQLMEPAYLANLINENKANDLLILSIGPDAIIKGSIDIGPTKEKANLDKMRNYLQNVPKDKEVVIYCGCCPFVKCPNVRPAFELLKEMGFKNAKLLNLATNIKTDWLDHDYPIYEE